MFKAVTLNSLFILSFRLRKKITLFAEQWLHSSLDLKTCSFCLIIKILPTTMLMVHTSRGSGGKNRLSISKKTF
jgi:hypothetical protein